jgi:hypothetical protein
MVQLAHDCREACRLVRDLRNPGHDIDGTLPVGQIEQQHGRLILQISSRSGQLALAL